MYQEHLQGLESSEPEVVLDSAIWIADNPSQVEDQDAYFKACELLFTASKEDVDCLKYIDQNLTADLIFKAQLFSRVLSEGSESDVKDASSLVLQELISQASALKAENTDMVAEIYSHLQDSGDSAVIEKSKSLL